MLLLINEKKVAKLLKSSSGGYAVFTADDVPTVIENYNYRPMYPATSEASGTIYTAPAVATETREHLASVRRKIEESGAPLKSFDELEKEIDEMRGRSR
ncbi:MAG: hypothetical protein LAN70_00670 [Acidobacteriia bacterium]|nr:hypothetical protein [Terriglobia bacterium]